LFDSIVSAVLNEPSGWNFATLDEALIEVAPEYEERYKQQRLKKIQDILESGEVENQHIKAYLESAVVTDNGE